MPFTFAPSLSPATRLIKLVLQSAKPDQIPADHWFWAEKAAKYSLPTAPRADFSEGERAKLVTAYLLELLNRYKSSMVIVQGFPSTETPGSCVSTLLLSFPTGLIPEGQFYPAQADSTIHSVSFRADKSDISAIGKMTLLEYCTQSSFPAVFAEDLQSSYKTILPLDELQAGLETNWHDLTGQLWTLSQTWTSLYSLVGNQDSTPPAKKDSTAATTTTTATPTLRLEEEYDKNGAIRPTTTADYRTEDGQTGKLVIGDIVFYVPPSSIAFSTDAQVVALPSMRTPSNPVITTNTSIPRVSLTLFFSGADAINNQFRPLLAMYRNAPFTTLQNKTIHKNLMGIELDKSQEHEIKEAEYFSKPIPIVLSSISVHTIAGYPNSLQADLAISVLNTAAYCPGGFEFLRTTNAAYQQASYMTRKYSKAFNLLHLDQSDDATKVGTATFSDVEGTITTHQPPQIPNTERTIYPAESWPFVRAYRSILTEGPQYPSFLTTSKRWTPYREATSDMELSYYTTLHLDILKKRLTTSLEGFKSIQGTLDMLYALLSNKDSDFSREYFDPKNRIAKSIPGILRWANNVVQDIQITAGLFKNISSAIKDASRSLHQLGSTETLTSAEFNLDQPFLNEDMDGISALTSTMQEYPKYMTTLDNLVSSTLDPTNSSTVDQAASAAVNKIPAEGVKILKDLNQTIIEHFANELNDKVVNRSSEDLEPHTLVLVSNSGDGTPLTTSHPSIQTSVFVAPVTGVSVSYLNNTIPMPVIGYTMPTFQHMGGTNARVSINLRTNDDNLLKTLADIKNSITTINRLVSSGEADLLRFSRLTIKHELLQSIGLERFSMASLTIESIDGSPGWSDVNIDLIQNDLQLTDYESLKLLQRPKVTAKAWELFCPLTGIKFSEQSKQSEIVAEYTKARNALTHQVPFQANPLLSEGAAMAAAFKANEVSTLQVSALKKLTSYMTAKYFVDPDTTLVEVFVFDSSEGTPWFKFQILDKYTGEVNSSLTKAYSKVLSPYLSRVSSILQLMLRLAPGPATVSSLPQQFKALVFAYTKMLIHNLSTLSTLRIGTRGGNVSVGSLILPQFTDGNNDFASVEGYALNNARARALIPIFRRHDFTRFLTAVIADKPAELSKEDYKTLTDLKSALETYQKSLDMTIGTTYPDLPIPVNTIPGTNFHHLLFGPAFYMYSELDFSDYRDMAGLVDNIRHSISLQLATLQGQQARQDYERLNETLNGRFAELTSKLGNKVPDFIKKDGKLVFDETFERFVDFHAATLAGYEAGKDTNFSSTKELLKSLDSKNAPLLPLFKDKLTVTYNDGETPIPATPEVTKKLWARAVTSAALLRYYVFMGSLAAALGITDEITSIDIKKTKDRDGHKKNLIVFYKRDSNGQEVEVRAVNPARAANAIFNKGYEGTLNLYAGMSAAATGGDDSEGGQVDRSQEARILKSIEQMKTEMDFLLTQGSSTAFAELMGVVDLDADNKRFELEQKIKAAFDSSPKSSMDRAFPTFKLFFVEENANNLLLFDDFYSYDALHSIDVVNSKHSASSTAIIKLSNVTNKLTGIDIASLFKDGSALDLPSMYLKPGTPIILRMGYGSDYRQLPIVFQGAITEVIPGSVVEITAQGWGAELNKKLGAEEPLVYGATSPVTTIGGVILAALDATGGLTHFGRWQQRGLGQSQNVITGPTVSKTLDLMRTPLLSWLTGTGIDFIMDQGHDGTNVSTMGSSLNAMLKGRSKDHLFLNIGNPLYDNIYVNGFHTKSYGFFNAIGGFNDLVKNFDWVISNQTTWEVLNEVCLHLGDYIVTPLPYNEGSNAHTQAPRLTLYMGPREGNYQAADSTISYESFDDLLQSQSSDFLDSLNAVALDGKSPSDKLISTMFDAQMPEIAKAMQHTLFRSEAFRRSVAQEAGEDMLDELQKHGYTALRNTALQTLQKLLTGNPLESTSHFTRNQGREGIWYTIACLLTGGQEGKAANFIMTYSDFNSLDRTKLERFINSGGADPQGFGPYTTQPSVISRLKTIQYETDFRLALKADLANTVIPRLMAESSSESKAGGVVLTELRKNLAALGGAAGNVYRPVVEHHFVNSYEDIIANNIVATADQMYNAVQLWFPDKPGGPAADHYNSFISYDLDPNYLRIYTSFQSNIDPNTWHDWKKASDALAYDNYDMLPAHIPIAHQILANQMRPMYQGHLSLLGNANIRPHHIVHIYDDITNMSGAVEVEEVVHSLSPSTGFTTTIVPNLLVYRRNMNSYVDQLHMHTLGNLRFNRVVSKSAVRATSGSMGYLLAKGLGTKLKSWAEKKLAVGAEAVSPGGIVDAAGKVIGEKSAGGVILDATGKVATSVAAEETAAATGVTKLGLRTVSALGNIAVPLTYLYGAYEVSKLVYDSLNVWAHQTIGMAGIAFGQSPLLFVPLIYNGRPYVAGMDGIDTFNRSTTTILVGQIQNAKGEKFGKAHPLITNTEYNTPTADE